MATEEQLSDEILRVWTKTGGCYKRAADEINASRIHIKRTQHNLVSALAMTSGSIKREGACWKEINRLRDFLEQIAEGRVEDVRAEAERVRQESYKL